MFLQIPGFGSRDMNDAVIVRTGGEDWIQYGAAIYRPVDGVPALAEGANAVTFDAGGHTEWRTVPETGQLSISAGSAWRLYDANMAVLAGGTTFPATAAAPAGSYLALFGPAASSTTVTLTLPVGSQSVAPTPAAPRHLTVPLPRPAPVPLDALPREVSR